MAGDKKQPRDFRPKDKRDKPKKEKKVKAKFRPKPKKTAGGDGDDGEQAAAVPAPPKRNKDKYNNKKKGSSPSASASTSSDQKKVHSSASENKPALSKLIKSGKPAKKAAKLAAPAPQLRTEQDVERIAAAALQSTSASSSKPQKEKKRKTPLNPSEAARPKPAASQTGTGMSAEASATIFNAPTDLDFPRGGGSSLTPLEYRQTLREARAEAAAADSSAAGAGGALFDEGDGGNKGKGKKGKGRASDVSGAAGGAGRPSKKQRMDGDHVVAAAAAAGLEKEESVRVEHLNYKRLAPGTRLLCTVLAVHPLALVLSLPNQLLGHVPITNISETFTQRLERIADDLDDEVESSSDEDEEEEEEEDSDDEDGSAAADQTGDLTSLSHLRKLSSGNKSSSSASRIPELRDMYAPGQFVIASVVSVASRGERAGARHGREGGEYERESRRVVLSLDPKVVNAGVELLSGDSASGHGAGDVAKGYVLPVAIRSKEDNGWVVDLGIDAGSATTVVAFVPFKETPAISATERYQYSLGQVLPACVKSLTTSSGRVAVQLSLLPDALAKAALGPSAAPSLSALLPGLLVNALVTSINNTGLGVKLWGLFDATIDRSHLPPTPQGKDGKRKELRDAYRLGAHITARILWGQGPSALRRAGNRRNGGGGASLGDEDDSDDDAASLADGLQDSEQERKIGLSAAEHIVGLVPPANLATLMPIGTEVEAAVLGCDSEWGLNVGVSLGDHLFPGFVHISRIADDHITRLTVATGPYKLGTTHRARVTGHALTDRLVLLSMQESVLAKSFMRVSQVSVGDVLRATVKEVRPTAIFLDLGGSVDGVVFPLHFSDIVLKKPEKKYKPGMKVNAKVVAVEPHRNRIALTLKKTIVNSELPALASLQDARIGLLTHGTVSKVLDGSRGLLVDFFSGVRALVPASEASDVPLADLRTQFYEGKPVMVRLTQVDYETERIFASIRQAMPSFQAKLNVDAVELGQTVDAKLAAVHQDVVVLTLVPSNVRALLSLSILATQRKQSVDELRATLEEGEQINGLVVVTKNAEKGIVIVGPPESASARALKKDSSDASVGNIVTARVIKESEPCAVQVMLPGKVRGRLHLLDCADTAEEAQLPKLDATIQCVVLGSRRGGAQVDVSARASVLKLAEAGSKDVASGVIGKVNEVKAGVKVHGFVKAISDKGLFVDIGRDVTARVKIAELFDGFIKEWKGKFKVGQLVRGTVTEVDLKKGQVELSLKTGSKAKEPAPKKEKAQAVASVGDYTAGQKVNGFIRAISEFGAFVQIENTQISGLCHKSELADSASADDALRAFKVGDMVKAKVLEVSAEKNRIAFGLKPSYFTVADFANGAAEAAPAAVDEDEEMASDEEDDEEEENDDDSEDFMMQDGSEVESGDEEDADFIEADDSAVVATERAALPPLGNGAVPKLELAGGFSWSGANGAGANVDDSEDEESEDEDAGLRQTTKSKGKSAKAITEDITADLASKAPESSTDFERILLGSPNSSFIWIQFMSFHLQLADVERAREVARRALKIINYREEQERMNVWIALLNLENTYGTDDTLEKTIKEAAAANDAKAVYLRMVQIFERTGKAEKAEELWKKTTKKFGQSSKVWVLYGQFLLRQGRFDDARQLIPRSMQSLEKRKHVKTVTAFALSEFKMGDAERGRTIFEGLLDTYPKRLDIWLQYIDQESRLIGASGSNGAAGSVSVVRGLFDRVLSLRQSTKKGKSVLKKWLEFEKRKGTPQGQQAVLERARTFVQETQKKGAAQNGEAHSEDEDEEME